MHIEFLSQFLAQGKMIVVDIFAFAMAAYYFC